MKILIPATIYQKLRGYAQATNFEISGLGKLSLNGKDIVIEDIKIFDQEVSYASTKLDRRALAKFYDELLQQDEDPSVWKMWWHSHAKMDTFWSATDVATIEDFDTEMDSDNWIFSLETNHKDEILTRIDIFKPLRVTVPKVPWEITFEDRQIEDDAFTETMLKIHTPAPKKKSNGKSILNPFKDKNKIHISGINQNQNLFPDDKPITIVEDGKIIRNE